MLKMQELEMENASKVRNETQCMVEGNFFPVSLLSYLYTKSYLIYSTLFVWAVGAATDSRQVPCFFLHRFIHE
jgi:hypothetical protein